ncbi:unnamed protein product, partial [Rotaria socialis]
DTLLDQKMFGPSIRILSVLPIALKLLVMPLLPPHAPAPFVVDLPSINAVNPFADMLLKRE